MQSVSSEGVRGKVIAITEADQGVGAECARLLASAGAILVLGARDAERLHAVAEELVWDGFVASVCRTDVSDYMQVEQLVATAVALHGRIDVFVNNAYSIVFHKGRHIDWAQLADDHIAGYLHGVIAANAHMSRQSAGHIVNVAPLLVPVLDGLDNVVHRTIFSSLTLALQEITDGLQKGLEPYPLRATLVTAVSVNANLHTTADAVAFEHCTAESIAHAVHFAIGQPAHVGVDKLCLRYF